MNISIIGGGNLGTAIARGIRQAGSDTNVIISRRNAGLIEPLKNAGIRITPSNIECIRDADLVILSVKPHQLDAVLNEIRPALKNQIVVSAVTGKDIGGIKKILGDSVPVFRAMPNTAISSRQSMTCLATNVTDEKQKQTVESLFKKLGDAVFIEEKMMDSATVLGACGIAYALRYIRAAMQAGIQIGFDSATALKIVTQTVVGASTLLMDNQTHPEREIDKVTTPQGCTIVGLNEMEHQGFSSAVIKGIEVSYEAIGDMKKNRS